MLYIYVAYLWRYNTFINMLFFWTNLLNLENRRFFLFKSTKVQKHRHLVVLSMWRGQWGINTESQSLPFDNKIRKYKPVTNVTSLWGNWARWLSHWIPQVPCKDWCLISCLWILGLWVRRTKESGRIVCWREMFSPVQLTWPPTLWSPDHLPFGHLDLLSPESDQGWMQIF